MPDCVVMEETKAEHVLTGAHLEPNAHVAGVRDHSCSHGDIAGSEVELLRV